MTIVTETERQLREEIAILTGQLKRARADALEEVFIAVQAKRLDRASLDNENDLGYATAIMDVMTAIHKLAAQPAASAEVEPSGNPGQLPPEAP